jgi:hypothetical protein
VVGLCDSTSLADYTPTSLVIAGLDPAIQRLVAEHSKALDARIKSAHDDCKDWALETLAGCLAGLR